MQQIIVLSMGRPRLHGPLRKPADIAMDVHDICQYDKSPNMKFTGYFRHKNGAGMFNTIASAYCATEGSPIMFGATAHSEQVPHRCGRRPAVYVWYQRQRVGAPAEP